MLGVLLAVYWDLHPGRGAHGLMEALFGLQADAADAALPDCCQVPVIDGPSTAWRRHGLRPPHHAHVSSFIAFLKTRVHGALAYMPSGVSLSSGCTAAR
jgi:hypothetical protein